MNNRIIGRIALARVQVKASVKETNETINRIQARRVGAYSVILPPPLDTVKKPANDNSKRV